MVKEPLIQTTVRLTRKQIDYVTGYKKHGDFSSNLRRIVNENIIESMEE